MSDKGPNPGPWRAHPEHPVIGKCGSAAAAFMTLVSTLGVRLNHEILLAPEMSKLFFNRYKKLKNRHSHY